MAQKLQLYSIKLPFLSWWVNVTVSETSLQPEEEEVSYFASQGLSVTVCLQGYEGELTVIYSLVASPPMLHI